MRLAPSAWQTNAPRAYFRRMIGGACRTSADGVCPMEDLLWLGAVAGLALITFAYAALCERA